MSVLERALHSNDLKIESRAREIIQRINYVPPHAKIAKIFRALQRHLNQLREDWGLYKRGTVKYRFMKARIDALKFQRDKQWHRWQSSLSRITGQASMTACRSASK